MGTETLGLALLLAPSAVGACEGPVRGGLTFYDAPTGAPFSGALKPVPGACELKGSVPWSAFSAEAIQGARGDAVVVRFRGERGVGGKVQNVDWRASVPRAAIGLTESVRVTLRRFMKAPDIHVGGLGLKKTTVNAEVEVLSPLHFNLRVAEARYKVEANGKEVASGVKEKFLVHGGRPNRIQVPISVNNGAALAAAGSTLARGGKVDGKLTGLARLRFPGGDLEFPIEFPVKLSLR